MPLLIYIRISVIFLSILRPNKKSLELLIVQQVNLIFYTFEHQEIHYGQSGYQYP